MSETTVVEIKKEYDFSTLENEKNILYSGSFVGVKFDMPMDVYTPLMLWMYNNIGVVLSVKAKITYPQVITNFTATGWYFHQKIGLEKDVSLSTDGFSLSINPEKYYDNPNQIQVETTYFP